MTAHVIAYLVGTLLGEVALAAWWMQQHEAGTSWTAYMRAQKGAAILSLSVALVACVAWSEGTLIAHLGWKLEETLGVSVVAGATIAFFAHGIIGLMRRKVGLEEEKKP